MDNNGYDSMDALAALIMIVWMASDVATLLLLDGVWWRSGTLTCASRCDNESMDLNT